jgi:hypothetical protein
MATSLKLTQVRGVVTGGSPAGGTDGQYYVTNTTSEASVETVNFDNHFFLFAEADDSYQHVCTVGDLEAYPDTKTGGIAYYRLTTVTQFFDELDDAWDHANLVKTRLQNLADDWEAYVNDPEGPFADTEVIVYSSS